MRQFILFLVLLSLIGYVAGEAVRGAHGLIANRQINARVEALTKELAQLKAQHAQLERDAALLKDKPAAHRSSTKRPARSSTWPGPPIS